MKKIFLFVFSMFLVGCSSNTIPYCEKYEYKTEKEKTQMFLKNGRVYQEKNSNGIISSQRGLFTYQDNLLTIYIKNTTQEYKLDDKDLIATNQSNTSFKCR